MAKHQNVFDRMRFCVFELSHTCSLTTAGAGHGQERHEPAPARVHGDVLHEEGSRCSDGDLQEAHHTEWRQVSSQRLRVVRNLPFISHLVSSFVRRYLTLKH